MLNGPICLKRDTNIINIDWGGLFFYYLPNNWSWNRSYNSSVYKYVIVHEAQCYFCVPSQKQNGWQPFIIQYKTEEPTTIWLIYICSNKHTFKNVFGRNEIMMEAVVPIDLLQHLICLSSLFLYVSEYINKLCYLFHSIMDE